MIFTKDLCLQSSYVSCILSHPFNILTTDILEATANCMLAQAEEGEFENFSEENIQALILDQFGECLSQILNLASNGISEELELFKIHNEETLFY